MILRFDDTNPMKEKEEYVDSILHDLRTLGISWSRLTHTSDYFPLITDYGRQLLREGKAYVDNTPVELMRKQRMDGVESPGRAASVEENLRLFEEMERGSEEGVKCCVRAKIDMKAGNKAMRDPTIFRCNAQPHHRTGSAAHCHTQRTHRHRQPTPHTTSCSYSLPRAGRHRGSDDVTVT